MSKSIFNHTRVEVAGIKPVPAMITPNGNVLHVSFGVSIEGVKA